MLVLQKSAKAKQIPKHKFHDTKRDAPLKISVQDGGKFPDLKENVIELDTGHFHTIRVTAHGSFAHTHDRKISLPGDSADSGVRTAPSAS